MSNVKQHHWNIGKHQKVLAYNWPMVNNCWTTLTVVRSSINNCVLFVCFFFCLFCCVGTQRVISFLRQIVEHGGFYRSSDQAWVTMERIQFVGACNPPTDPGRKPLSHRSVMLFLILKENLKSTMKLNSDLGTEIWTVFKRPSRDQNQLNCRANHKR